jgi:ABC-type spermidine/putrescine transport system permease subunit I
MTAISAEHAPDETPRSRVRGAFAKAQIANLWLLVPAVVVVLLFFVLPVALIVPQSAYRDGHFTWAVYWSVLTDSYYALVLWRSMWLSFVSTVVCILLAYPIAYYATRLGRGANTSATST